MDVKENILEESAVDWELDIQHLSIIWSLKTMKKKSNMNLKVLRWQVQNSLGQPFRGRK